MKQPDEGRKRLSAAILKLASKGNIDLSKAISENCNLDLKKVCELTNGRVDPEVILSIEEVALN